MFIGQFILLLPELEVMGLFEICMFIKVLQGTSCALLKLWKIYHQRLDSVLAEEITALKARLQNRQDFHTIIRKIDGFTKRVADEYENKKVKKIKHLFRDKNNTKNAAEERDITAKNNQTENKIIVW